MPGGSGIELLARVKERLPGLPVIVMTAYSDLDSAVASFQGGAFEYLPKPFDVTKAVELIRRALDESLREEVRRRARRADARDARPGTGDAGRVSRHRPPQPEHRHGADHGRERLGQGTRRARAAQAQPACRRAVRRDQHGRDPEGPARERAVRPRARRFHRRADDAPRPLRAGRRRHAVPRRDRRHALRPADAPAARAVRRAVLPRRRPQPAAQQRARDRGDAPEPGGARQAGRVPRGSVPPSERDPPAPAGAARAHRGRAGTDALLPRQERPRIGRRGQTHHGAARCSA